jgi:hypothetical protein
MTRSQLSSLIATVLVLRHCGKDESRIIQRVAEKYSMSVKRAADIVTALVALRVEI